MEIKISVITVVFNNEIGIEETIKSVLSQDFSNVEYIIIDGKSTDKTLDIIKKYSDRIFKIISEKDKNLYDAINKGIKFSTGEYIYLLHSGDVFFSNNVLSTYVSHLNNSDLYLSNMVASNGLKGYLIKPQFKMLWKNMLLNHPTWLVKRSVFSDYGNYDDNFRIAADYDFALRNWNHLKISYLNFESIRFSLMGISYGNKNVLKEAYLVRKINNINSLLNYCIYQFELFFLFVYKFKDRFKRAIYNNKS